MQKLFSVLFISAHSLFLVNCTNQNNSNSQNPDGTIKVDEFVVRKGRTISNNEWKCYEIQYDRICFPINWKLVDQKDRLLVARLKETDSISFFTVVRYDIVANKVGVENYLAALYSAVYSDTVERLDSYSFKQLNFNDKIAFYGEFNLHLNNSKYIVFSMIFDLKGILYDITLKTEDSNREKDYQIFQDILYNYQANGKHIFSEVEPLISFKEIDLSKVGLEN